MSRMNARKLYIIKMLHTSAAPESPVTVRSIAEYLRENGIACDEETVLRDTVQLQSSGIPILFSESDSSSCYIEK